MAPPGVAVIVPCFNDGATVEETVASVHGQDTEVELVVVDDGSTDAATHAAFERLKAAGVRVHHQANTGLPGARMAGLAATQAPYVLPLDADDQLVPHAVRRLRDALDAHPRAGAAWGWYQRFGGAAYVQRTAPELDAWQVTYQNDLPVCALFRREALEDAGGWQIKGGYEDWDLWMAFAERGWSGVGLPEVLFLYRSHGTRMLADSRKRHADIHATLRARHPALFAARAENRRRSGAPAVLKATLPLIDRLPVGVQRRRVLAGVACHLAYRRGLRTLVERARSGG